jgi:hypothetical protein
MKKTIILGVILILGFSFLVDACPYEKSEDWGHKECKFENGEECLFAEDGGCPLKAGIFKLGHTYSTLGLMPLYTSWYEKKDFRFHSWKYGGYKEGGCDKSSENYDLDGDGEITKEEKMAFFLENYDLDGDGQITWEEKKSVWESKRDSLE